MIYQKIAVFLLSAVPRHGALRGSGADAIQTFGFECVFWTPTAVAPAKTTGRGGVKVLLATKVLSPHQPEMATNIGFVRGCAARSAYR